jgi:hypothetical protein
MKLLLMKASAVIYVIVVCATSVTESGMYSYHCHLKGVTTGRWIACVVDMDL